MSDDLRHDLENFVASHDFVDLYKSYDWGPDIWQSGFPKILEHELEITNAAKNNLLEKKHVLSVAKWGRLRNPGRIRCPQTITLRLYEDGLPSKTIRENPASPLQTLQAEVEGLGPAYLGKVLRFAVPSEFGAIDTRIVRVMGIGDPDSKLHNWLSLEAHNTGFGWYVPKNQPAWPDEYSKWINILRTIAHSLNDFGKPCPHPEAFLRSVLRRKGIWDCADVEMALFSHASRSLKVRKSVTSR